jgi:hypothetical protein
MMSSKNVHMVFIQKVDFENVKKKYQIHISFVILQYNILTIARPYYYYFFFLIRHQWKQQ